MAASTDDARVSEGGNESTSSKANAKPAAASKEKRKVTGGKVAVPEVLKFTSWWDEDREESSLGNGSSAGGGLKRRYVSLKFYCADGTFDVTMKGDTVSETVELRGIDTIVNRQGEKLECWDLHIGMKLELLGRKMTLMQADLVTVNWLEYQASKLRKIKKHLLDELRKFSTRALDNSLIYDQGLRHPGESCLRTVIVQIHKLCAELQAFRPAVAKKCLSSLETGAY